MNVIVTKSYEESCTRAADIIRALVSARPDAKLGLATGGTPVPIYRQLVESNQKGEVDFSRVRTVNLDEYVGLAGSHPQSYRYFMDTNLFDHINIDKANTYVADGLGEPEECARALDEKVHEGGAPALQLLGIGNNGHIAFNEAGDALTAESHIEELTDSTIDANARFFDSRDEVPTRAITMGMKGILAAEKILLVATGAGKAEAMRGLLCGGEITTKNPATFLKLHRDVTVILDEELAGLAAYKA